MPFVVLLAFVVLGVLALVVWWLLRANPSTIARILRPMLMVVGLATLGRQRPEAQPLLIRLPSLSSNPRAPAPGTLNIRLQAI